MMGNPISQGMAQTSTVRNRMRSGQVVMDQDDLDGYSVEGRLDGDFVYGGVSGQRPPVRSMTSCRLRICSSMMRSCS